MIVGIPAETFSGERRVALAPESVQRLVAKKIQVWLQSGAGAAGAWFSDDDYRRAGATIEASVDALLSSSDLIVKIHAPSPSEAELMKPAATLICLLYPRLNLEATRRLAERRITAVALENLPRSTVRKRWTSSVRRARRRVTAR